jgi:hypothetical protein
MLKKRVKIMNEILDTERNYFELMSLIPLVSQYFLVHSQKFFSNPLKQQNILDADTTQKIFLNYENIVQISSKLLFVLTGNEQGPQPQLRRVTSWVSKDDMEIPIATIMQRKTIRQFDRYTPPVLFGKTFVEFVSTFYAFML